jgi:23S rRNA (cytosine1962-C5)-methyltransferase
VSFGHRNGWREQQKRSRARGPHRDHPRDPQREPHRKANRGRAARPPEPAPEAHALIDRALARRADLLADPETNARRLLSGPGDGVDGLVVEQLGPVLVAQLHLGRLLVTENATKTLCQHLMERTGATAVYRKIFPKDRSHLDADLEASHRSTHPWLGSPAPPELEVREHGMSFIVRPYDGYATGLYLDHRAQRACVRAHAQGSRVLNAFAYTCAFAVAAGMNATAQTVNVDISRKSLEWGKRNLAANGLEPDRHRFIKSDVFDYYQRAERQGHRFDFVILDPPTFARARRPRRSFSLVEDLDRLVVGALELLDSTGRLLLSVNHRGTSAERLEAAVRAAGRAVGRRVADVQALPAPADFGGESEGAKAILVEFG